MVKVHCSDSSIKQIITGLCQLILDNGGIIHDGVCLIETNGHLSLICDQSVPQGEPLILLPAACLLPLEDFSFSLYDDAIAWSPNAKAISELHTQLMDLMTGLYNQTGKLQSLKHYSVLGAHYIHPELTRAISKARSFIDIDGYTPLHTLDRELFLLQQFIESRGLISGRADDESSKVLCLAPIIDFLNYHPDAPGLGVASEDGQSAARVVVNFSPDASGECFLNYGQLDAADSMILHHYVETRSSFVRSIPLHCEIEDGWSLDIRSALFGADPNDIDLGLQNIAQLVPAVGVDDAKKQIMLSHLLIPGEQTPYAMRRILVNALGKRIETEDRQHTLAAVIESEVISANMAYYQNLLELLDSREWDSGVKGVLDNARLMATTQIEKIKAYPFFDEAMAHSPSEAANELARQNS